MHSVAVINFTAAVLTRGFVERGSPSAAPQLVPTVLVNFFLGVVAIVCLKEQRQTRACLLGFAFATASLAILGFFQGIWALGIIVSLWSVASFHRWWKERNVHRFTMRIGKQTVAVPLNQWHRESRISRLFGTKASDFENLE